MPLLLKKKSLPPQDTAEESASDSLVPIRRERLELKRQEQRKRLAPAATDQVSRLTAAHETAAAAAATAMADEASESTVERVAKHARRQSLQEHAPASAAATAAAASPVVTVVARTVGALVPREDGAATSVHAAADGTMPPMSMSANYDTFKRALTEQATTSSSAATGQMGERLALIASDLVRRVEAQQDGAVPTKLPRLMASMASPLESTFLRRLVVDAANAADIPPHLNYVGDSVDAMRQYLSVSRRAHEEVMLRVPSQGEPACPRNEDCRGNQIICPGGGATLISYQDEEVWTRYAADRRRGTTDSRLPNNHRLCVLCTRFDVESFLVSMRNDNVQLRLVSGVDSAGPPPALIQPHFNLTDVAGEYRLEDCNSPVGALYEGLLYPIVKASLRCFRRTTCADTGVVKFEQLLAYPGQKAVDSRVMPPPPRF